MPQNEYPPEFTKRTIRHIRCSAIRLAGLPGFTWSDVEDTEQQMILAVWRALPRFDPSKASLDTFVDRVVGTVVGMLERHREREMRDHGRRAYSMDVNWLSTFGDGEGGNFGGEYLDLRTPRGQERRDPREMKMIASEVRVALAQAPRRLRIVGEMLMRGVSARDASVALGIPWTTFKRNFFYPLRCYLLQKNLGNSGPLRHPRHK